MRRSICRYRYGTVLATVFGLALAGCAQTRWEKPTADANTAAADQSECEQGSSLAARQQVMFERLSGPRPVRNGVIGYPTGNGGFYERNNEWLYTQQFFESCMRNKGYRLVRVQ
jgi:hypothetical protein